MLMTIPASSCLNPGCGATFTPVRSSNKYCSPRCSNRVRYLAKNGRDPAALVAKCAGCGNHFAARGEHKRFCSRECQRAELNRVTRVDPRLRTCAHSECDIQFEHGGTRKVYCSRAHAALAHTQKTRGLPCTVDGCLNGQKAGGLCGGHWHRLRYQGSVGETDLRLVHPVGTRLFTETGYVKVKLAQPNVWELEHRVIAEAQLGRKLLPGENVHHKNGVRSDNVPTNLELWTTAQPPGQRVDEKIDWAIEFLGQYGYEVVAHELVNRRVA